MAAPAISAIPFTLPGSVWRGNELGTCRTATTASGHAALDRELPGGGWPASTLTELLLPAPGSGEWRLLAPALATLARSGKSVILVGAPHLPLADALQQLGLDLRRLLLVDAGSPADCLWAAEQVLKSDSAGALLCWLPRAQPEQLRRLQLAASGSSSLCFLFRPLAMRAHASPAPLRLACQPAAGGGIRIEIVKRRGPVHAAPLELALPLHPVLARALTNRAASQPSSSVHHAVDCHSLPATSTRRRATLLA